MERNGIERLVQKNIPYFEHLSAAGKSKFITRLTNHFVYKNFEGRKGQRITREVKTMISAAATQLTFGLNYSFLSHFKTYVVFPRKFQLNKNYPEMYGATVPNGRVYFSLKKLEEGYANYSDGVNLGIHEFSHALVIEHRVGVIEDMDWRGEYDEWFSKTYRVLKKSSREERSYFRRDILKTPTEMFPILVEVFFEKPDSFYLNFPGIYMSLVRLLNQNPRRKSSDYRPFVSWSNYFKTHN